MPDAPPTTLSAAAAAALRVPADRPVYPRPEDAAAWHRHVAASDSAALASTTGPPPHVEARTVAGIPVSVVEAPGPALNLHFHGGALILMGGPLVPHDAASEAESTGLRTWSVDYRMPPDHPFPAGLDDCTAVYAHAVEHHDGPLVLSGTSAGGNLACATLLRAQAAGLPMPAALVLRSPEVDLTESGDSFRTLADADHTLASLGPVNALYARGRALDDPLVSPLFGDLSGFPPTFIQSGTRDLFLSNAVRLHQRLLGWDVHAELYVVEAMPHCGFGPSPEHDEIDRQIRRFVRAQVSSQER